MRITIVVIVLLLFTSISHARVYTWVDENGKKHFGDIIPSQYQGQVDDVNVEIHTPTEKQVQDAKGRANNYSREVKSIKKKRQERRDNAKRNAQAKKKREKSSSNDYESRMAEYRESEACFIRCRRPIIVENSYGLKYQQGFDLSACGHCKNVKKPSP